MPMKQGRLPPWHIVIRDLKRGAPKVIYEDRGGEITRKVTLLNSMIPEQHQAELNPNNPLETDRISAWDIERQQWATFNISSLELYEPYPGWEEDRNSGNEKGKATRRRFERKN